MLCHIFGISLSINLIEFNKIFKINLLNIIWNNKKADVDDLRIYMYVYSYFMFSMLSTCKIFVSSK